MISKFTEHFPAFSAALDERSLKTLLAATTTLELPPRRKLIRDRMSVDSLYFLIEGEVAISIEEGGRKIPLGHLGPGQWLGEISVLSGELLASSTVTTVTPVTLLRMKHQAFEELLSSNEVLASAMLNQLTDMLAERLRVSLAAGNVPIAAADIDEPPKKGGFLWALFGSSGG